MALNIYGSLAWFGTLSFSFSHVVQRGAIGLKGFYVNVRPAKWGVTAKLCYNNNYYYLNHLIIAGLHSPQYFYLLLLVLIKFQIHPVTIKIPPGCLE